MSFKKYLVEKLKLNEMYSPTLAQIKAEKELNKQGFKFSNWIDADPDAEGEPSEEGGELGTMVMTKRGITKFDKEYREIWPDGSIN